MQVPFPLLVMPLIQTPPPPLPPLLLL